MKLEIYKLDYGTKQSFSKLCQTQQTTEGFLSVNGVQTIVIAKLLDA